MPAAAVIAEPVRDEQSRPPWWTEADQAELDALLRELIDGIWEHRLRCSSCAQVAAREIAVCPHIQKAIAVVVDWRDRRMLVSRALWLRTAPALLEFKRDLAAFRRGAQ